MMRKLPTTMLLFTALYLTAFPATREADTEGENTVKEEIIQTAKDLIRAQDTTGAMEFINGQDSPLEAAQLYSDLVMDFYWKERSLSNTVMIARAGLDYCRSKADETAGSSPDTSHDLKGVAKMISYNLASFTWPGWDEKGIVVGRDDIVTGLEAARLNLRLVEELKDDDLSFSNAYWIVGAQLIAVQKYDEAIEAFKSAKKYAESAGARLNQLLCDGYIGVTMITSGQKEGQKVLDQAESELNEIGSDDAKFFIKQFHSVLNVFIK
jgi:tetratricopeptide (TPR) repeat protein